MKLINVVGARPNFMKIAPIMKQLKGHKSINSLLLHTGQHYDSKMSHLFFEELKIQQPDIYLEVGSDSHAKQTAKIMKEKLEAVMLMHFVMARIIFLILPMAILELFLI